MTASDYSEQVAKVAVKYGFDDFDPENMEDLKRLLEHVEINFEMTKIAVQHARMGGA
jgi:hypothetical protein